MSLSDSEISSMKPKHTLKFLDIEDPIESKKVSRKDKEKTTPSNTISIQFTLPTEPKGIFGTGKSKSKSDVDWGWSENEDGSTDDTWYPPVHPKSKNKIKQIDINDTKKKKKKKEKKPKEERWSFWQKQLPDEIEYCPEEIKYFMKQSITDRKSFMTAEHYILDNAKTEIPLRFKFLRSNHFSPSIKLHIIRKIDSWYAMEPQQNEYHKMTNWIQSLEKIPFEKYFPTIPKLIEQRKTNIVDFLTDAQTMMNKAVYGHDEAKEQILELLAKDYTKSLDVEVGKSHSYGGFCLGIQGPAGNGKTTLVKEGIAKALGRPFSLIGLGGAKNSDSFVGHDYTYEGAMCGRVVQALQMSNVMNPIIYFDELDKISKDEKGDEIAHLLCHLTDPSQNTKFEDKYFSGIPIDLSQVMFIFSFNDESMLNPILKDRIQIIRTNGLQEKQKQVIVRDYILPEIKKELPGMEFNIPPDVVSYIVREYTRKEKGVRNLKRAINSLCRKINLHRILKSSSEIKLFTKLSHDWKDSKIDITKEMVKDLLKTDVDTRSVSHLYL